jgi:hypothetical protein
MIAAAIARPTPGVLCPDGKLYEHGDPSPVLSGAGLITFSGAGNAPKYGSENNGRALYWHPAGDVIGQRPCPAAVFKTGPIVEAVCLDNLDPVEKARTS